MIQAGAASSTAWAECKVGREAKKGRAAVNLVFFLISPSGFSG